MDHEHKGSGLLLRLAGHTLEAPASLIDKPRAFHDPEITRGSLLSAGFAVAHDSVARKMPAPGACARSYPGHQGGMPRSPPSLHMQSAV
jgi:hypothetical protein